MFHSPCSPSWYSMIHSSNNSRRRMICSFKSPSHIPSSYLFSLVIPPLPGLAVPSCRQHPYLLPCPMGSYRSPAPVVPHGAWPAVAGLAVPTPGPPSLSLRYSPVPSSRSSRWSMTHCCRTCWVHPRLPGHAMPTPGSQSPSIRYSPVPSSHSSRWDTAHYYRAPRPYSSPTLTCPPNPHPPSHCCVHPRPVRQILIGPQLP